MKILVCGDRFWSDIELIAEVIATYSSDTILVHGACHLGGADIIAGEVAKQLGFEVREYPADWKTYGKKAGPIRNLEMLKKEHLENEPIDEVIGFHNDIVNSSGTKHMLNSAIKAKIKTRLVTNTTVLELADRLR